MKKLFAFVSVMALVCVFASSAMAAEWNFYGSARFQTFSVEKDKDFIKKKNELADEKKVDDDRDTVWKLDDAVTRVGFKVNHGDWGGHVELRAAGSHVRHWYGYWNFGAGQLLVGQTWSPLSTLYSNQGYQDNGLGKFGDNSYRTQMIQMKFGGLKIALVSPGSGDVNSFADWESSSYSRGLAYEASANVGGDKDISIPKIEFRYNIPLENFTFDIAGGYNWSELVRTVLDDEGESKEKTYDIHSWTIQAGGKANLGPMYLTLQTYYSQNFGNYGAWDERVYNNALLNGKDDIEDVNSLGVLSTIGFKANDMVTIEGGLGYIKSDAEILGADFEDTAYSWYVQAKLTLSKSVYLIPEVGQYNYDEYEMKYDDGSSFTREEGAETYVGAKWQINF
ncbi:hypothetical protein QUF80_14775 [Desulfococcaceae bacterium HSG8]|nr:hypothetical protein [Desulfococcaceae bacterium HSG8]